MTITEMRRILAESGIQLTKSLGQNFLHDANQLRRIVNMAELSEEDSVLEVGPGLGPLTKLLLARSGRVLAIEKDRRLARWLQKNFVDAPSLELVHDDALDYLRRAKGRDWSEWKMVANLPYSVGSPILVEWALAEPKPAMMVVTLQWEVVNRIRATAGSRDYGVLSLLLQAGYVPIGSFRVPAACFFPQPEVASACIALKRRRDPLLAGTDFQRFVQLVKAGFRQRRKIMLNLLKTHWPEPLLRECFAAQGIDFLARSESVTLEQFARLAQMLPNGRALAAPQIAPNPDYAQRDGRNFRRGERAE